MKLSASECLNFKRLMTLQVLNCIMLMAFPFFFHTEHLDQDIETALSLAFIRFRIGPLEVIQATATSVAHSREELMSRSGMLSNILVIEYYY